MSREPPMIDPTSGRHSMPDDDLVTDLANALHGMVVNFRPFTLKPVGEAGSRARIEQDEQNKAYREACRVLDRARRITDT